MNTITKILGANWRTTLTGYLTGAFLIVEPIITNGNFDPKRDWKQCVFALAAAVYGNVSKDKQVTGGTTPNDIKNDNH